MGACYWVQAKLLLTNEKAAINALQNKIATDTKTNYSLELYAKRGVTTETFDDLMRIILAGWKHQEVAIVKKDGFAIYENAFDASYGWENVMIEMFYVLSPFLEDNSHLKIYPDEGEHFLIIRDEKVV